MLAQLKDPTLCVAKLWNLAAKIKRRESRGARESFEMTVLRSRFIMCMYLVTHQETFFQQQVLSPLTCGCVERSHIRFQWTHWQSRQASSNSWWVRVTPRRFNLLASHWESSLRKVKIPLKKIFFEGRKKEIRNNKEKLYDLRQLLLLLKTKKGGRRGPRPVDDRESCYQQPGWPGLVLLGEYHFLCGMR